MEKWGKGTPGRGNCKCKDLGTEVSLVPAGNFQSGHVAGAGGWGGSEAGGLGRVGSRGQILTWVSSLS